MFHTYDPPRPTIRVRRKKIAQTDNIRNEYEYSPVFADIRNLLKIFLSCELCNRLYINIYREIRNSVCFQWHLSCSLIGGKSNKEFQLFIFEIKVYFNAFIGLIVLYLFIIEKSFTSSGLEPTVAPMTSLFIVVT